MARVANAITPSLAPRKVVFMAGFLRRYQGNRVGRTLAGPRNRPGNSRRYFTDRTFGHLVVAGDGPPPRESGARLRRGRRGRAVVVQERIGRHGFADLRAAGGPDHAV